MPRSLFHDKGISLKEILRLTWREIREDDVFGRAAQLGYYFFLALFPFLICVIATLSLLGLADRGRALLFHFFSGTLPPSAYGLIDSTFAGIIHSGGPLKVSLGLIGSIWSASMGMSAVMDTVNSAYNLKESRSVAKQYGVAISLTAGIALLLVISVAIVLFGDTIVDWLRPGPFITEAWKIAQWPFALALILFAFAVTYYFAPDLKQRRWHWITPGSIVGTVIWLIVSFGFRFYLHFFNTYDSTYGSLGGVIVLLLWFYLSGVAILTGAALNGVLERLAEPEQRASREPQLPFPESSAA
jgi:membrane protein